MIVVDTSALMAIALDEPRADASIAVLESAGDLLVSGVTVTEALIVADRRGVGTAMRNAIDTFDFQIRPVGRAQARRVATPYAQWGKGAHPAALNFADCFAYALAKQEGCPLLFVGTDSARTDIRPALAP